MIKYIISDFSRTLLFPKVATEIQEMNAINKMKIAETLGVDISNIPHQILVSGADEHGHAFYDVNSVYALNFPLIEAMKEFKMKGIKLLIFTSGYVQNHPQLRRKLDGVFEKVINVEENGGYKKTDPQAYANIYIKLREITPDLKNENILYISDELNALNAAKELDIQTYLFPKIGSTSMLNFFDTEAKNFRDFVSELNVVKIHTVLTNHL